MATAATDYAPLRVPLPQARHLPGYFYTSPEIYALEKEKIFRKEWLCVGREEEIERPGDYLTFRVADEPLLVCRDEHGQLNAFYNVCRHRGTEVACGRGNAKSFSCPYHAWTYNLKGRLVGAPHTKEIENFQFSDFSLVPLRIDTWAGFVFVSFESHPISLTEFLGDFPEVYAPYRFEELQVADTIVSELDCNWKFAVENLVDTYHVAALHGESFGAYQPLDTYEFQLTKGGYHSQFKGGTITPDGKSLFGPFPWLPEEYLHGGYSSHLRPNLAFFPRFDFHSFITCWPLETERCVSITYLLFPKQHFELPDFQNRCQVYVDFYKAILDEDKSMILSLQKGMKSRAFQPGPMSRFETAIHNVANHYLDCLYGDAEH